jgi:hypothetical protein
MSSFEIRAMSGSLAPTNGRATLSSVTPSAWSSGGGTGTNDDVIRPWSGGPKITNGTRLYVHGGGHTDSHNNGLYSFEFSGGSAPTGWSLLAISDPSSVNLDSGGSYSDGLPNSVHTYGGMCEMGGAFWRVGGSQAGSGGMIRALWRYDMGRGTWARMPDCPYPCTGALIGNASGSATGKLLSIDRWGNGYTTYGFFTPNGSGSSGSWSSGKDVPSQWPDDPEIAYRPTSSTTGTILVVGGNGAYSCNVDWSAETLTSQTSRSIPTSSQGPFVVYDNARDVYWSMAGNNYSTIYEINPSSYAATAHSLSAAMANNETTEYHGVFGRYVFMPDARAIGVVFSRSSSVYVIKLP